jgi:hypothetical protein
MGEGMLEVCIVMVVLIVTEGTALYLLNDSGTRKPGTVYTSFPMPNLPKSSKRTKVTGCRLGSDEVAVRLKARFANDLIECLPDVPGDGGLLYISEEPKILV